MSIKTFRQTATAACTQTRMAIAVMMAFLAWSHPAHAQADRQPTALTTLQWGDQGNGTYINPVLNADFSDPDVIRVGNTYYMVASDFHFLGIQVLESEDLVNWHIVSQVFDSFDYPDWNENRHYGGGSWAPSIRWHDGRFYVYFCTYEEGLFMATAEQAKGPWTPLHCIKKIPKWEDPCPFWDDDGQAYLGRSQWGAGPIILHKMSADGRQLLDDGVTVYTGPVAEGTKFLKRNGYYYLIIPEGGVGGGWQTVLRSRNIYGPYEKRVVLEQGSTSINGPHQGALVDTPDSTWWFFHFQETHPRGRVVHLQPARWKDDWPLMGVDIDGNGIGEPVYFWGCPGKGVGTMVTTASTGAKELTHGLSDEFTADALYWVGQRQRALRLQWQWNHNPIDSAWSLTERRGWLTFHILPAADMKSSRNMLTQKTVGYTSEAVTKMDFSKMVEGDHAGLHCIAKRFMGVGVCRQDGHTLLYLEQDGERHVIGPCSQKTIYLKVSIDSRQNSHQFAYSTDGKRYTSIGEPFSMRMGNWKGSRIGLHSYNISNGRIGTNSDSPVRKETKKATGKVCFDFFRYDIRS